MIKIIQKEAPECTHRERTAGLKELIEVELGENLSSGGKVAIGRSNLVQILVDIGNGRRQEDLVDGMDVAVGSLDVGHFGNDHGIVVQNDIAVVSRGSLPETLDSVVFVVGKCTLVFVEIFQAALFVVLARIVVGIVLIANAILVLGAFLLTFGESHTLVLVKVTLSTVDAASPIVSANVFLAIDSNGIQIIA